MVAAVFGTLSFLLSVIFLTPWIKSFIGDMPASLGVSACIGGCLVYVCRGIDILLYEMHDNPPPFMSPFDVLTTMDRLMQLFKAARRGPQYWYVKEAVLEEGRMAVILSFTEIYDGLFSHPMQLNRSIIGTILVRELPEDHKPNELEEIIQGKWKVANPKPWSLVTIKWEVDSPLTRSSCSEAIDYISREILYALDYERPPQKKRLSPLVPPPWMLAALVCSIYYALTISDQHQQQIEQAQMRREQRQQQMQQVQQEQQVPDAIQQQQELYNQQRQILDEYKRRSQPQMINQAPTTVLPAPPTSSVQESEFARRFRDAPSSNQDGR